MIKPLKIILLCIALILFLGTGINAGEAQEQARWAGPNRLSTDASQANDNPAILADLYGYVHVFWPETNPSGNRPAIQYSRFDGNTWSPPLDIFVFRADVVLELGNAVVDQSGNLYLIWSEGNSGPVYFSHAPAYDTLSAQKWLKPVGVDIPAYALKMKVDSKGVFHILYIDFYGNEPGIYYVRSKDQGITWSAPHSLDPNISADFAPNKLEFVLGESDSLHAVWQFSALNEPGFPGKWVRYANSLDGGESWSTVLIDEADETSDELRAASPIIAVQDRFVHIIWAGNRSVNREYRFSADEGQTWSPTYRIFENLEGAAGDGLIVDGAGRIHYVGQIRYPQGLYHSVLEVGQWSKPSLFYLISLNPADPIGDRIHAHRVNLAVRAGNQLVSVFTDAPSDPQVRLFAMYTSLDGIPPAQPLSIPDPTAVPLPDPTQTLTVPTPTSASQVVSINPDVPQETEIPPPSYTLIWAVIPTLLLLGGVVVYSIRKSHNGRLDSRRQESRRE